MQYHLKNSYVALIKGATIRALSFCEFYAGLKQSQSMGEGESCLGSAQLERYLVVYKINGLLNEESCRYQY